MVLKFFSLKGSDEDSCGVLATDLLEQDIIDNEWREYYNGEHGDVEIGVEVFAEKMQIKYPQNQFERIFVEDVYL